MVTQKIDRHHADGLAMRAEQNPIADIRSGCANKLHARGLVIQAARAPYICCRRQKAAGIIDFSSTPEMPEMRSRY